MSLSLPDFGGRAERSTGAPRIVFASGLVVLAIVAAQWASAALAAREVAGTVGALRDAVEGLESTERARRDALRRSPQRVVAATAIASSPDVVLADLASVLPSDVALRSLRGQYGDDGVARFEVRVDAANAAGYDRFLEALAASKRFDDIRPGSEGREGRVSASLSLIHRPALTPDPRPVKARSSR